MSKHKLELVDDYNFFLLGIASHEKDYRLCWAINKQLGTDLTKIESLEIKGKKQITPSHFSFYQFINEEEFLEYYIVSNISESKEHTEQNSSLFEKAEKNKSANEFLIPEQKQMNYFLIIRGEVSDEQSEYFVKKIKEIDSVQTALCIKASELKSKQNLIF